MYLFQNACAVFLSIWLLLLRSSYLEELDTLSLDLAKVVALTEKRTDPNCNILDLNQVKGI